MFYYMLTYAKISLKFKAAALTSISTCVLETLMGLSLALTNFKSDIDLVLGTSS